MDSDLPTPLHIIQDSRYAKQDGWQLDDISLCSSGNIAVSGHYDGYPHQSYVSIYGSTTTDDNSDSRDKPTLLYHKQFTDEVSWRPRCISFIKPNSTEIVTCRYNEVQVIDYNRDVVLRSRKVNGETTCLSVSESQIFIGLEWSDIVNIYDNDLNEIKSIRLKGIGDDCPRDIAAAADILCVCTDRYDRAIVYSQDSGSILTEYTIGQYRHARSIAVNVQLGLTAVLLEPYYYTGQNQIIFYLLSENKSFLTVNVEYGVSRIRISDQGRIVAGNGYTGEVKIYMLHSFVTYDSLKQFWRALLQKDDCKRLTDHFQLPKDQTESILMSDTPTNDLLLALEEREFIYSSNVNRLIDVFVALQMNETYYKLANIYQENASATAYDRFLVTLSAHLTASLAGDLCSHFNIPHYEKNNITSNQNPGLSLLLALDKMGIINQSRVLAMEEAFANLKLVQAVAKIREYQTMVEDERDLFHHTTSLTKEEKRNLFLKLLQKKIMSWYEAMTPVPWKKSCQWKSSELFVGSRLILTNSKNGRKSVNVDEKCKLKYTEIFTHESLKEETRIIIEGDPGSGKTMLSSQLAYDWYQGKIGDINILILLPLKFVERKSLLEATKEFYAIEGKGLSLVDIEDIIIREGVKCCFILDGLEEYNGKDETLAEEISEVMKVMTKIKYPKCKVILTSRSDYAQDLPSCPMLKLGTFGEAQRQSYIEKVFCDDHEKQMKVKEVIDETSFIQDLCSVPLLFVLAVHNIGSIVNVQDVWQDRVSPFIGTMLETLCPSVQKEDNGRECRYMQHDEDSKVFLNDDLDILGYHRDFDDYSDMSDSDSELDVHETYQYRSQGISLEMLAFNGLCRGKQQLSWQKKFVEDNVKNVKKYLDSGILVVEDAANVGMNNARTDKENVDTTQFEAVFSEVNENASGAWNIPTKRDSDSSRVEITQRESVKEAFQEMQKGSVDITFKDFESRYVEEFSDVLENTDQNDNSTNEQLAVHRESEHSEYLKTTLTIQHVSLQVKFLHKVLQEWFAAKYLAGICWKYSKLALPNTYNFFKEPLQQINPADLHYVLRFTCALCPPSCHLILNYLLSTFRSEEGKIPGHIMNCICLCLAEYDGYKGHYIKDVISEVCKADITINSEDSRLIQRTKVSMLKLASVCGFPVSRLQLLDVVVSASEDELTFTSGATLQTLHTLHEIEMSRWDNALKEHDYTNIVKFISNSKSIKKAFLYFPSQPPVLEPETLKEVAAKEISVSWHIGQIIQTLDPSKGLWMPIFGTMTKAGQTALKNKEDDFMSYESFLMSLPDKSSNPFGKLPTKRPLSKLLHSEMKVDTAAKRSKMNWNLKLKSKKEYEKKEALNSSKGSMLEEPSTSYFEEKFIKEEISMQGVPQVLVKEETAENDSEQKMWTINPAGTQEQSPYTVHHERSFLQAQETITESGGTIEIPNTGVVLRVPPDALPKDRQECLIKMRIIPISMSYDETTSFCSNSSVRVELLPNHFKFRCHVELTLPHCLKLKRNVNYRAKVFMSHHNEGERPQWEEQNEQFYDLRERKCIIFLKSFCWIKFEIDNEIVEGKRLKLYTAAKKMHLTDQCVAVHVGYHLDMPGEQEILRMNPNLILQQRHPFLFLREGEQPLMVQLLRIIPEEWKHSDENAKEISFLSVATSIEDSCKFVVEKKTHNHSIPMCMFVASQKQRIGKRVKERTVELMIRPEHYPNEGIVQGQQMKPNTDSMIATFQFLAKNLSNEWKPLGRKLCLEEPDIYLIERDFRRTEEAVYQMLQCWRKTQGSSATYALLVTALKQVGRQDLAEKVQHVKDVFEEC